MAYTSRTPEGFIFLPDDSPGGFMPAVSLFFYCLRELEHQQASAVDTTRLYAPLDLRKPLQAAFPPELHFAEHIGLSTQSYLEVARKNPKVFGSGRNGGVLFWEANKLFGTLRPHTQPVVHQLLQGADQDTLFIFNPTGLFHFGPLVMNWYEAQFKEGKPTMVLATPYFQFDEKYEENQFAPGQEWVIKLASRLFLRRGNAAAQEFYGSRAHTFGLEQLLSIIDHIDYLIDPALVKDAQLQESIETGSTHSFLGYPQMEYSQEHFELPTNLQRWIAEAKNANDDIVILTLGSMQIAPDNKKGVVQALAEAAYRKGNTRVLVLGEQYEDINTYRVRPLFVTEFVDYAQLFSQADFIVTHGGAGTTAHILETQKQQQRALGYYTTHAIYLPILADQFSWHEKMNNIHASLGQLEILDLYKPHKPNFEKAINKLTELLSAPTHTQLQISLLAAGLMSEINSPQAAFFEHHYNAPQRT